MPGKQVLRSGTSGGANYREASRARSRAEFISEIGDSLKETEETEYWLKLLVDSGCVPTATMAGLLDETRELIAIFTTIDKKQKAEMKAEAKAETKAKVKKNYERTVQGFAFRFL